MQKLIPSLAIALMLSLSACHHSTPKEQSHGRDPVPSYVNSTESTNDDMSIGQRPGHKP